MSPITDDTAAKLREAAEIYLGHRSLSNRYKFALALSPDETISGQAQTVLSLLDEVDALSEICRGDEYLSLLRSNLAAAEARSTALEAERDAEKARADAAEAYLAEYRDHAHPFQKDRADTAEATISTLTAERDAARAALSRAVDEAVADAFDGCFANARAVLARTGEPKDE